MCSLRSSAASAWHAIHDGIRDLSFCSVRPVGPQVSATGLDLRSLGARISSFQPIEWLCSWTVVSGMDVPNITRRP
jgi:hypothetical protein